MHVDEGETVQAGEVLIGTESSEGIEALGGNDWIIPGAGDDVIDGGAGVNDITQNGANSPDDLL